MRSDAQLLDVLARVVGETGPAALGPVRESDLERLGELAVVHRVPGPLVGALSAAGRACPEPLRRARDAVLVQHLRVGQTLASVGQALASRGITWAVVKGPALAAAWYRDPAARRYDDVDLLVAPEDFPGAVDALRAAGFEYRSQNWSGLRRLEVGELSLYHGAVVVDLHWSLLGLGRARAAFALPTVELLGRAPELALPTVTTRMLEVHDAFTHLVVHHGLAGARDLLQLNDIRVVAAQVDPEVARRRLEAAGAERLAAAVLDRVERYLGRPDHGLTTGQLGRHRAWVTLNRGLDRAWSRTHAGEPPGLLVAAARRTGPATAAALGGMLGERLRERVGRPTLIATGGPLDAAHATGGPEERDRFLAEVAAGAYGR